MGCESWPLCFPLLTLSWGMWTDAPLFLSGLRLPQRTHCFAILVSAQMGGERRGGQPWSLLP